MYIYVFVIVCMCVSMSVYVYILALVCLSVYMSETSALHWKPVRVVRTCCHLMSLLIPENIGEDNLASVALSLNRLPGEKHMLLICFVIKALVLESPCTFLGSVLSVLQ